MSLREIFRAEQLPVFQNKLFSTEAEAVACARGDVFLVQDMDTGLVFNACFDPELLVYDIDYQNEQAHSQAFQMHLVGVESILARHLQGMSLIEVGCGKGYFLERLRQAGYSITGIDPAYEGNDPNVVKALFEPGLGLTAEGIVLRQVLEHVREPVTFLADIARANQGRGRIYIEVPCFDWICRQRAWFDIFYEHVNYFRIVDFQRMFGSVLEVGHLFGGQYLYVVADLTSLRPCRATARDAISFPADFLAGIKYHASRLEGGKNIENAIWGGSSKGVIFALYMQRAHAPVDMVIDINPAKQCKYIAASGLQVHSPEGGLRNLQPGSNIFVMNSNYLVEIIAQSKNLFTYHTVDRHDFRKGNSGTHRVQ